MVEWSVGHKLSAKRCFQAWRVVDGRLRNVGSTVYTIDEAMKLAKSAGPMNV